PRLPGLPDTQRRQSLPLTPLGHVIPASAGIQRASVDSRISKRMPRSWIPAFAGMTREMYAIKKRRRSRDCGVALRGVGCGRPPQDHEMKSVENIGRSAPLGATIIDGGTNFSIYSRTATAVELLFFDREDAAVPSRIFPLDSAANRSYHYWHTFVHGVKPGQLYGYRVSGPADPSRGLRFDSNKVLLDPYGRAVAVPQNYSRGNALLPGANAATAMKSVVVDPEDYDWEDDAPLQRPASRTIIYEMHVRGFTRHQSSRLSDEKRGTYAGVIEKIPY